MSQSSACLWPPSHKLSHRTELVYDEASSNILPARPKQLSCACSRNQADRMQDLHKGRTATLLKKSRSEFSKDWPLSSPAEDKSKSFTHEVQMQPSRTEKLYLIQINNKTHHHLSPITRSTPLKKPRKEYLHPILPHFLTAHLQLTPQLLHTPHLLT